MHRPIGALILGAVAFVAGLYQLYRVLIFAGAVSFTFVGKSVSYNSIQWGPLLWALILAAIWFYVAFGFFSARAYAWMFGVIISMFTLIFSSLAVLGVSTLEAESVPLLISLIVLLYLFYPGTQQAFADSEVAHISGQR
jgi:hypothetical protein